MPKKDRSAQNLARKRSKKLTAEQRSTIAKKAAMARWHPKPKPSP